MKRFALFAVVALLLGATLAQTSTSETEQSTQELRQEAARLALLNTLPEEARADAEGLLDELASLREEQQALQQQMLEATVAALEEGESAQVARLLAQQSVLDEQIALAREMEAFRTEVDAFLTDYPEAARLLRAGLQVRQGRDGAMGFGMGQQGQQGRGMQRRGFREGNPGFRQYAPQLPAQPQSGGDAG